MMILAVVYSAGHALFVGGALSSNRLAGEGDRLVAALVEARQRAVSRNLHVEVRFYHYLDPKRGNVSRFWAWEILEMGDNTFYLTIGGRRILDSPVILSEAPELSPLLLDSSRVLQDGLNLDGFSEEMNCKYAVFRFEPDGSTDLPAWPADNEDEQWFVTLVRETDVPVPEPGAAPGDQDLVVPADFVAVQIDPLTGQVRTFRP